MHVFSAERILLHSQKLCRPTLDLCMQQNAENGKISEFRNVKQFWIFRSPLFFHMIAGRECFIRTVISVVDMHRHCWLICHASIDMICISDLTWLMPCRSPWNIRLQTTSLRPALSCAADSIFLQLHLKPAVHIFSSPYVQLSPSGFTCAVPRTRTRTRFGDRSFGVASLELFACCVASGRRQRTVQKTAKTHLFD